MNLNEKIADLINKTEGVPINPLNMVIEEKKEILFNSHVNYPGISEPVSPIEDDIIIGKINKFQGGKVYHYIKGEYFDSMIENNSFKMSSLNRFMHSEADPDELMFFIHKYQYHSKEYGFQDVLDQKKDWFIWCLTTEKDNPNHWENYAGKDGVCVEFNLTIKNGNIPGCFQWGKVLYENDLRILDEISNLIKSDHENAKVKFWFSKALQISQFVKRQKFDWEKEIRLVLNKNVKSQLEKHGAFGKKHPNVDFIKQLSFEKDFLSVDFQNPFFDLKPFSFKRNGDNNWTII